MRILLIEDEARIAGFVGRGLREEGHQVVVAEDLAAARATLAGNSFDLLVVDRMLPDGDGLDVVRELRRRRQPFAAICLSARDRVEEKVEGLHGGADDYLVKPFRFEELLARIAAVSRRTRGDGERIAIGDLVIDTAAHRVTRAGQDIRLTAKEFALVRALGEQSGRVMSRTVLLERVWDARHDPGTNVVDVVVSYLRAKIDKGFAKPLLHTVRGIGYVLEERPR